MRDILLIIFLILSIFLIIFGIKFKRFSFIIICALISNATLFLLLRIKFEWYNWMITGPHPGYCGLGAGLAFIITCLASLIWLLVDLLLFFLENRKNDSTQLKSSYKTSYYFVTIIGAIFTALVSTYHIGPIIIYIIKN